MEVLREMFHDLPEPDLAQALTQASNDVEHAIALVLERPTPNPPQKPKPLPLPPRLANLTKLAAVGGDGNERPPLTPATASANMFGNMTLGDRENCVLDLTQVKEEEEEEEEDERPMEPQLPRDEETETIENIISIFPDACPEFVKRVYREHHVLQGPNIVEFLANRFADEGYEKKQWAGTKRKRKDSDDGSVREEATYEDVNRPPATYEYRLIAKQLFMQEFPMMPANFIEKVLKEKNYFITTAYPELVASEKVQKSNPRSVTYKPLLKERALKSLDEDMASRRGQSFTKIMEELELARKKARELEMTKQLEADAKLAEQLDENEYAAAEMLLECQCCFTDTPFDKMTHCAEGEHFFCLDCARQYAESRIGEGKHKLVCMDGSGCQAEFPRREVLRFIKSQKTLDLLSKFETEAAVRSAEIENLVQCPFCDNAAICNSVEVDREFRCDNEECGITSCRLCQRQSHTPKTCEEAAKDDKISTRHLLEEAMSEAVMRKCKKCGTPSIKEYGCNKMMCTKCSTMSCYVCNTIITGYNHFDDKSRGGKSGNCPLFDNHEDRHEEEAKAAAEAVKAKIRAGNPDITDEDLEIQLSESAKKQEQERRARAAPQGGGGGAHRLPAGAIRQMANIIPPYNPGANPPPRMVARGPLPGTPPLMFANLHPPPPLNFDASQSLQAPARRELGNRAPANFAPPPNIYFIPNNGAAIQVAQQQPPPPPPPPVQRSRRIADYEQQLAAQAAVMDQQMVPAAIARAQADAQHAAQLARDGAQFARDGAQFARDGAQFARNGAQFARDGAQFAQAYRPTPPKYGKTLQQQQQQQNHQQMNLMGSNLSPNMQQYNPGLYGAPSARSRTVAAGGQGGYAPHPQVPPAQYGSRSHGGR